VTLLRAFGRRLLLAAALLAGLAAGGWLAAGSLTTAPAADVPSRHCETRDLGAYTGVVVGPDPAQTPVRAHRPAAGRRRPAVAGCGAGST
jgi:hypothetical protein